MKNEQVGPDAAVLEDLVSRLTYKDGWKFSLSSVDRGQGSEGLTFQIRIKTEDSIGDRGTIYVMHYMPVPPAGYDEMNWTRWLMDQVILVERHEAMEFFKISGVAPFFPHHEAGNDPYVF